MLILKKIDIARNTHTHTHSREKYEGIIFQPSREGVAPPMIIDLCMMRERERERERVRARNERSVLFHARDVHAHRAPGREGGAGSDGTTRSAGREGCPGEAREEGKLQRGPPANDHRPNRDRTKPYSPSPSSFFFSKHFFENIYILLPPLHPPENFP